MSSEPASLADEASLEPRREPGSSGAHGGDLWVCVRLVEAEVAGETAARWDSGEAEDTDSDGVTGEAITSAPVDRAENVPVGVEMGRRAGSAEPAGEAAAARESEDCEADADEAEEASAVVQREMAAGPDEEGDWAG